MCQWSWTMHAIIMSIMEWVLFIIQLSGPIIIVKDLTMVAGNKKKLKPSDSQ